jgi:small subunit ribosomal protein S1
MKQLTKHPWEAVAAKYPDGTKVKGKIVSITDYGVFVELDQGVEGFIPTSKLTTDNIRNPAEAFKPGDVVPAAVIEVEAASRKLTLSVVFTEANANGGTGPAGNPAQRAGIDGNEPANSVFSERGSR